MSADRRDSWAAGDPYERYVGRWSRPVATQFLGWLDLPPRLALARCRLRHRRAERRHPRRCEPEAVIGSIRPQGFLELAARRAAGHPRPLRGGERAGPALGRRQRRRRRVRPGVELRAGPAASDRRDGAGRPVAARSPSTSGTTPARCSSCAISGTPRRRSTPRPPSSMKACRFPICRPEPLAALFRDGGLEAVATRPIDVPTVFADFDDYWSPFLGGQGRRPATA